MSLISVDVEADGGAPGLYSMVCFGAVVVRDGLYDVYYSGILKPISDKWIPESLSISGISRDEMMSVGKEPAAVMEDFESWLKSVSNGQPIFISDNNGFDWSFINYYFWRYLDRNPFGWTSRRIGDLWCGMEMDTHSSWKHLRKTKHTHNPVDDAMGNAEVVLQMQKLGLKIKLK